MMIAESDAIKADDAVLALSSRSDIELAESVRNFITPEQIEQLESKMLDYEQANIPVAHYFSPGVYFRKITMPRGVFAIGHAHQHDCMNIVLTGSVSVLIKGEVRRISAPFVFLGKAGERKVGYVHEDLTWITAHATNETDLAKLEEDLLIKSDAFLAHERRLKAGFVPMPLQPKSDYCQLLDELGITDGEVQARSENPHDLIPMPLAATGRVFVRQSSIHGRGLFASMPFGTGTVIVPARIGCMRTSAGRFTNHSHEPNARMCLDDNSTINLVAIGDIAVGDELTINYRQAMQVAAQADKLLT